MPAIQERSITLGVSGNDVVSTEIVMSPSLLCPRASLIKDVPIFPGNPDYRGK